VAARACAALNLAVAGYIYVYMACIQGRGGDGSSAPPASRLASCEVKLSSLSIASLRPAAFCS